MKSRTNKIPNPYTLSWRYMKNNGQYSEWNHNQGQFMGWEMIRIQLGILCRSKKHHRFEFEIKFQDKNWNQKGEEINGTFVL